MNTLFSKNILNNIVDFFNKNWKTLSIIFVSTFIFGLIAHGFSYFNIFYNFDSTVFYQMDEIIWKMKLGRFVQPLYFFLRGGLYSPSLVGFLSLLFSSCSTLLIVKILKINKKIDIILVSLLLVVNNTFIMLNATFIHEVDSFALSILLLCIGVYLFVKKNKRFKFLFSSIFFILSMGIYQSNIQLAFAFLFILSIERLYKNDEKKSIGIFTGKFFISILFSVLVYYGIYRIVQVCYQNIEPETTQIAYDYILGQVDNLFKIDVFLTRLFGSYPHFFVHFCNDYLFNNVFLCIINSLYLLVLVILYSLNVKKNYLNKKDIVFCFACFLLFPFFFFAVAYSLLKINPLTCYAFQIFYIWGVKLKADYSTNDNKQSYSDQCVKLTVVTSQVILLLSYFFSTIISSNNTYLEAELQFRNTYAIFESIINRIESLDGYEVNVTPVAIVGNFEDSPLSNKHDYFTYKYPVVECKFSVSPINLQLESYRFINKIMQHPVNILLDVSKYESLDAVKNMPVFPYNDSCALINGTVVVKLS